MNIPEVKLGIIAVSRDCFPIALSTRRRQSIAAAYGEGLYECPVTVENEGDALTALADVEGAGCNALVVFLGNFGPETPETIIAQRFDGPVMYVAAAEGDGDLINGRGDAYCGMLNCSYNLGMRHLKAYIPEYPVGTAEEIAEMIREFIPIARAVIGVKDLKIITFGPRPQDFFACNAPIRGLYELGVEVEENSELDLLVAYKAHKDAPRIPEICADMAKEMGEGRYYPEMNERMAQLEVTLLDSLNKRVEFLRYVCGQLGLKGVEFAKERAEEAARKTWREQFDLASARAVAALADCAREIYAGAANLQELLQKLAAQLNTESLHFN